MDNIDTKILDDISKELMCFRVDIKNKGNESNAIYVISAEGCKITTPKWFKNEHGTGTVIEGLGNKQLIKVKAIHDGTLMLSFKGKDKRFEDKRFPLWTDYESIKIDGKEILSTPIATWHDKPYKYNIFIKDEQEVTIEFELKKHLYFLEELTDLLQKLFHDNKVIRNNIKDITSQIQKTYGRSKIIGLRGFYYTGSSVMVGFFNEFDNTTVLGMCERQYSAQALTNISGELTFFTATNFFNFIDIFYSDNLLEKDFVIKKFIDDIYNVYDAKGAKPFEKNPAFYTDDFLKASITLLQNVIDLDEYTVNFMKDKRYPIKWNSAKDKFQNCSFMKGKGISQYIFYQFKNITKEEFEKYISSYVNSIFNEIESKEYLVCDQMLSERKNLSMLDRLNNYLVGAPLKEICVYRDPRDRFLSAFRIDTKNLQRNIDKYEAGYRKRLDHYILKPNKNRLMIRFEDMVLKYEETTKKIMDFIGMDPSHHVAPKSVFDPALSVVNIGAYKQFVDQDFMRQIEERMPEYCYYPEKENLSQEALNLLKGTENG